MATESESESEPEAAPIFSPQESQDDDDDFSALATTANPSISRVLADLRRSHLSIGNRLRSVRADARFVASVAAAYGGRPLIANERCGSWYVTPALKSGSAYFKSTDGHAGQWAFSARRLNLHLLGLLGARDGAVVVDSTRRGKLMPDALSKTVPIWCCVLNRVLFPELAAGEGEGDGEGEGGYYHALRTPPNAVSPSEHAQIAARIPAHVATLRGLALDLRALRALLAKPLRPIWVTPESHLPSEDGGGGGAVVFDDFHPVICCTSSRRAAAGETTGGHAAGGYVQGAGDDTENWALGLTPALFWAHADGLLADDDDDDTVPEAELRARVRRIVADAKVEAEEGGGAAESSRKRVAPRVYVSRLPGDDATACTIAFVPRTTDPEAWVVGPTRMEVGIGKNAKVAGRNLRVALPRVCEFVRDFFEGRRPGGDSAGAASSSSSPPGGVAAPPDEGKSVVIACETGGDLSIGAALALLCRCFDAEGRYDGGSGGAAAGGGVTKSVIKLKLSRIMMAFPEANPSRTTLQSVNSFLMG